MAVGNTLAWTRARWRMRASTGMHPTAASAVVAVDEPCWAAPSCHAVVSSSAPEPAAWGPSPRVRGLRGPAARAGVRAQSLHLSQPPRPLSRLQRRRQQRPPPKELARSQSLLRALRSLPTFSGEPPTHRRGIHRRHHHHHHHRRHSGRHRHHQCDLGSESDSGSCSSSPSSPSSESSEEDGFFLGERIPLPPHLCRLRPAQDNATGTPKSPSPQLPRSWRPGMPRQTRDKNCIVA